MNEDSLSEYWLISNPRMIHRALQRSNLIYSLRRALVTGEITESTIRAFANSLLRELEHGRRFRHEMSIAALAVALENRPTPFAEEFVLDLARLEMSELSVAVRVAREACKENLKLAGNKSKSLAIGETQAPQSSWPTRIRSSRVGVGQTEGNFVLGAP